MHHAILMTGQRAEALARIPEDDRTFSADALLYEFDRLGVDDVRRLKHEAVLSPVTRAYRSFVVAFDTATNEAQNAMLKLLEEPVATTRFYIVVPREDVLLATVRSRLMFVPSTHAVTTTTGVFAAFLATPYAERLVEVAARTKEKDAAWIGTLLAEAESWADTHANRAAMDDLIRIRQHIDRSGASKKMLLEELALTLPVRTG